MSPVLLQGSSQRTLPKENEPRQAFFFNGSHPTLGVSVQVWTPGRQHNRSAPIGFDQLPERGAEFCIAILQQIVVFGQKSPLFQGDRPGLLFHPLLVRMPRDSRYTDPARLQVDEEQHVVGDWALPGQDFRREEVRRRHNIQVGANEIFPTDAVLPQGCGSSSMAPQNVAHGLV